MIRRSVSRSNSQESLLSAQEQLSSSSPNSGIKKSGSASTFQLIPESDVEDVHCDDERSVNNNSNNNNSDSNSNSNSNSNKRNNNNTMSSIKNMWSTVSGYMNSTRLMVLLVLCLQNSLFTVLRRYSQGVLQENYSKHELLLVAESIKILYSSWMISKNLASSSSSSSSEEDGGPSKSLSRQLMYLISTSRKMFVLALIYGVMNILSFVSLRNISAGMFTIFAQCKILTTATFSTIMLKRQYSWTKWRALIALMMGVLLFSAPIWDGDSAAENPSSSYGNPFIGTAAVLIEVTLSGFASIYFEKVIKTDPLQLGIWERNFQLALGSFPVYILFIIGDGGGTAGFFGGWSWLTCLLSALGAAGGLLVALSIKYGDSILKTLATTGAIVLTGVLDHLFLGGPLTPSMMIAGVQVIIAICNYTFDASPAISMPDLNNAIAATTTTTTDLNTAAGSLPSKSMLKSSRTSSTSIPSGDGTMTMTRGDNNDESSRSSNSNSNSSNKNETEKLIRRS